MIIYIYGEDTYRSREYLRDAVLKFKKQRDPQGYNVVFLDGKKISSSKLFAEINTAPFLGEKKMVIVENLLVSSDKELLAEVIEKVKNKSFPESTAFVVWQGESMSKVKEVKELQELLTKEKYSTRLDHLSGLALVAWVEEKIKEKGGQIEKSALQKLVENNSDEWKLVGVINQLVALCNGKMIRTEEVEEFSEKKLEDNIFNFTDAVVSGNHKKALSLLKQLRETGEDDGKLFGTILWQFRILIEMSDLLEREGNLTSDQIAKKLAVHPFVAKKNLAVVKQYSLARLEALYGLLLETDIKTKTGRGSQSLLLDLFVVKV